MNTNIMINVTESPPLGVTPQGPKFPKSKLIIYSHIILTQQLILPLDISLVLMDSDMVVQLVSPGQTWCLILNLVFLELIFV